MYGHIWFRTSSSIHLVSGFHRPIFFFVPHPFFCFFCFFSIMLPLTSCRKHIKTPDSCPASSITDHCRSGLMPLQSCQVKTLDGQVVKWVKGSWDITRSMKWSLKKKKGKAELLLVNYSSFNVKSHRVCAITASRPAQVRRIMTQSLNGSNSVCVCVCACACLFFLWHLLLTV